MSPGAKLTVFMGLAVTVFLAGRWLLARLVGPPPPPSAHQSSYGDKAGDATHQRVDRPD